jgi:hypothetical protein
LDLAQSQAFFRCEPLLLLFLTRLAWCGWGRQQGDFNDIANLGAEFVTNYNTVESFMMASAIVITVFGRPPHPQAAAAAAADDDDEGDDDDDDDDSSQWMT